MPENALKIKIVEKKIQNKSHHFNFVLGKQCHRKFRKKCNFYINPRYP